MPENQEMHLPPPRSQLTATRRAARARGALRVYFFVVGMVIAVWASRIPEVKDQAGVTAGELSIALLGLASGALMAMRVAGPLLDRYGGRAVVPPAGVAASALLVGPGHVSGFAALLCALLLLGATHALLNVSINVLATRLQQELGRPIMASFHAACSIGGCTGAVTGMLCARIGLSPSASFQLVAAVLVCACLLVRRELRGIGAAAAPGAPAPAAPPAPPAGRRWVVPPKRILLLGLLAMCCTLAEGAATDWSALYMREVAGGSATIGAATYASYSAMMAAGRLVGDRVTAMIGAVNVVRVCGLLGSGGLCLALAAPAQGPVIVGFGLMGAGLSCLMPHMFTAAAEHDPPRAARNVCTVSAICYLGPLIGPAAIGAIAGRAGLATALALPALLLFVVGVSAGMLRPVSSGGARPRAAGAARRARASGRLRPRDRSLSLLPWPRRTPRPLPPAHRRDDGRDRRELRTDRGAPGRGSAERAPRQRRRAARHF
ncbi:MFS transporter [Nocardiopsis sediminis]|uniref:MFS transporter n=1 Tax=Nocardiopsis sediminis TaxID=1778267 RepID=A0ABV8FY55_9ACTN